MRANPPTDAANGGRMAAAGRLQVYPNPARGSQTFEFSRAPGAPGFGIYDVAGRLVRSVPDAGRPGEPYRFVWDGLDAQGNEVPAAVYFVRAWAGSAFEPRGTRVVRR